MIAKAYRYASSAPRSPDFLLKVDGEQHFVLRTPNADLAIFSGDGPFVVEVALFVRNQPQRVTVRPRSLKIEPRLESWKIHLTIPRPVPGVIVGVPGLRPLYLFPCPPEENVPDPTSPGVHFFRGGELHEVGELTLHDGEAAYLEGGAIVRGCIRAKNSADVAIRGRGVLDGHYEPWVEQGHHRMLMAFDRCTKVQVEGITAIRPLFMTTVLGACREARVSGLHALTELVSTDGVDVIGSSHVRIENCFLATNDDCVAIKAAEWAYSPADEIGHWRENVNDVLVTGCTLLNRGAGNVLEIGHETNCERIAHICFENCDILEKPGCGAVFAVHHCDRALIEDIRYECIRVEQYFDRLFDLRIMHSVFADGAGRPGPVRGLRFADLEITRTAVNEGYSISVIGGYDERTRIEDVIFDRIRFNGRETKSLDELQLHQRHVGRIRFLNSAGERASSLRLEELSSPAIKGLIANGYHTVLVSVASTEQHGPALPLGVDVLHGRETCVRAAQRLGSTLVGPDVNFGYAPQHASFAGSISLRDETLRAILEDVAVSLAAAGFKLVYFWIAHAENFPALRAVLPGLERRFPGCSVAGLDSMARYGAATWDMMGPPLGSPTEQAGSHAGEIETSLMLAAAPELVRMEVAEAGSPKPFGELAEQMMREGMAAVSPNGVLGDQRSGDARRGHAYFDLLADYLVREVATLQVKLGLRSE